MSHDGLKIIEPGHPAERSANALGFRHDLRRISRAT
jgi:hypothetical protein